MNARSFACGALAFAALAFSAAANSATIQLRASLDGAQVPLAVNGTGTGTVIFDTVSKALSWNVGFQNLTGACTDAHFHGPASAGVDNAPTVGMTCSTSPLTGSSAPLNATQEAQLLSGQWYINIHTAAHPGGEIRGQVVRVRGDASGDGNADVFWRNAATGENYFYPMQGTAILGGEGYLRTVADLNWQVAGVGDFDGDGRADLLWRNAVTGENYIYFLNGTTIAQEGYLRTVADHNWKVAGVGDFDGDAKDDILWRNGSTGENYLYPMDGLTIKGTEGYLRTVADSSWKVAGIGDFDGDGYADILWRNAASGENYVYPMNGTSILAGEGYLRTVASPLWRVAGVGDLGGDGRADIVWRNVVTGENYVYPMNGTTILGTEGYLRRVVDLAWGIAGVGDHDGDGKADVLWRRAVTGANYLYPMDGLAIKSTEGFVRSVADASWQIRPAAGAPVIPANLVFVTSTTYAANFGSVAPYDAACAARAAAAGLPGEYIAWLSSSTSDAVTRLGFPRGWSRVDGLPFADTLAELTSGKILYPPQLDEYGSVVAGGSTVFTSTLHDGTQGGFSCTNWTSTSGNAAFGRPDSGGGSWSLAPGTRSCASPGRLYCVGKSAVVALNIERSRGRRAFLSAVSLPSNTSTAFWDTLCQTDANSAGLTGTYKALLATSSASAASRFSTSGAPWVRVDGIPVFDPPAHLAASIMSAPLNVTAAGAYTTYATTWVGASGFGAAGSTESTCSNWASTTGTPYIGVADQASPIAPTASCSSSRRVYCLQQ